MGLSNLGQNPQTVNGLGIPCRNYLPCLVHFGPFSLAARVLAPSVGPADWAAIPEAPNRTIQIRHTPLSSPANFILSLTTIPGIRAKIKKSRPLGGP